MIGESGPSLVWPVTHDQAPHGPPPWLSIPDAGREVSATGIVWDLDSSGVRLLEECLESDFPHLRIRLVAAVYAASPTTGDVLRKLLALVEASQGRLEAALAVIGLEGNASPMSALCFSDLKSGRSQFWVGNSGNLCYGATRYGHLNFRFEPDDALASRWLEWFASAWSLAAPLTPMTANAPTLVPAAGTNEASDSWREYELLCTKMGSPEKLHLDVVPPATSASEEAQKREQAAAELCKEMGIQPPDQLRERLAQLLAKGQVVTIDKGSRIPPLELPIAKYLGVPELGTEMIDVKAAAKIRIFDEKDSKDLEKRRKGVTDLISKLTYPLADGVRWMPLGAQPLLERERSRLKKEARDRLKSLVGRSASEFASSRRQQIEHEVNEVYAKLHLGKSLPPGNINLILRDMEDRLVKANGESFLPKVSYATQQFSFGVSSEHVAQWAPARTLLAAIVEYARKAVREKGHLRGHEIPESELLQAMNVCDDHILRMQRDSKTQQLAKRELHLLEEILIDGSDDRSMCDRILHLIKGPETSRS